MQSNVDTANAEFWNELCGSGLAKVLGIGDHTPESLRQFDDAYLRIYPYLLPLVGPERMANRRVLEIGLGYGTLGQKLVEAGADYSGLDISPGPVAMMNHRLRQANLPGQAVRGSALDIPFPQATFDFVVSIGCLHHTGDVRRCFAEVHRVLKPGGAAILMLYNKFSYRQWLSAPAATLHELLHVKNNNAVSPERIAAERRKLLDANSKGQAAPETVLLSVGQLRNLLGDFEQLSFTRRTGRPVIQDWWNPKTWMRSLFLNTVGRAFGLDIYLEARKAKVQPLLLTNVRRTFGLDIPIEERIGTETGAARRAA